MCGLIKRDNLEDIDIGFAFLPEYNGKGYAEEVVSATISYAKEKLGLNTLVAITLPENIKSISLLQKTGFVFEKKIIPQRSGEELLLFRNKLK